MSGKRVLFFFPHCPYPARTGAHRRCLEMLWALRELECDLHFASSIQSSDTTWTDDAVVGLQNLTGAKVHIAPMDEPFVSRMIDSMKRVSPYRWKWRFEQLWQRCAPLGATRWCPPGVIRWFQDLSDCLAPDVVMMNYVIWDGLVPHDRWKHANRIVDLHDLWSLNFKQRSLIIPYLSDSAVAQGEIAKDILDLGFFGKYPQCADDDEFKVIDKYRHSIAISRREYNIVSKHTQSVFVSHIPMSYAVSDCIPTMGGLPVITLGHMPFNLQGYFLFTKQIIPSIVRKVPDFRVHATGMRDDGSVWAPDQIQMLGFVPDLEQVYRMASFSINPVFGGTGQQIKTIEAMAHGLAVVLFRGPARESPVRHGENGYIADTPEEFADYCCLLWRDRDLARRLGENARETVRTECSRERTKESLADIL